jgi:hypothetical protein
MITLTNTSSTTRIRQTEHTEAVAEATTRAEVSAEASEAAAASVATETAAENLKPYAKRSALYVESQDAGQQSIHLKSDSSHSTSIKAELKTTLLGATKAS